MAALAGQGRADYGLILSALLLSQAFWPEHDALLDALLDPLLDAFRAASRRATDDGVPQLAARLPGLEPT